MDDVILNKIAIIERCFERINEEYASSSHNLYSNYTKQDSIILNLQRMCEASIDIAMHIVRVERLGIPQDSRDAFELLRRDGIIADDLALALKNMVGFRNIAVHDYRSVNL